MKTVLVFVEKLYGNNIYSFISNNRFDLLLVNPHFIDNDRSAKHLGLYKLSALVEKFLNIFQNEIMLGEELCSDFI